MSNFKIKKITPSIGAELIGENIFNDLNPSLCNQIYDTLIKNKVIFFRNQNLSNDQHIKFAKSFGEIEPPHPVYPHVDQYPEIVLLENIKNLGKIGDVVDVKRGHGRNFLIKYGKALKASKTNIDLVNKKNSYLNYISFSTLQIL